LGNVFVDISLDLVVEVGGIVAIKDNNFASRRKPPRVGEVEIPKIEVRITVVWI
jgi:hypothetical protein